MVVVAPSSSMTWNGGEVRLRGKKLFVQSFFFLCVPLSSSSPGPGVIGSYNFFRNLRAARSQVDERLWHTRRNGSLPSSISRLVPRHRTIVTQNLPVGPVPSSVPGDPIKRFLKNLARSTLEKPGSSSTFYCVEL